MANVSRKVPKALKIRLIAEAGGKCANPGCPSTRVEFHHIKHWAVVNSHRIEDMIAVCPTCHDSIHHGSLAIDDGTVRSWKAIKRPASNARGHLYVEPTQAGNEITVVAGTVRLRSKYSQQTIVEMPNGNSFSFRILDDCILLLTVHLHDVNGEQILKVVDNHIAVDTANATFVQNTGHVRITVPTNSTYVPVWMFDQIKNEDSSFGSTGEVVALELKVIAPGTVKAIGFWPDKLCGMAFTTDAMMFCVKDNPNSPIVIVTELSDSTDELATITYGGDVINPMFAFER